MPAPMPTRATITASLTFGMVAVPIEVYSATEESAVRRSMFVRGTDHPVGQKKYDKVTGEDVPADQIMSCVAASDGSLVEITDDEIAAAVGAAEEFDADTIRIIGFLPLIRLYDGTYSVEKHYMARPARLKKGRTKVPNKAASKAFVLLTSGMAESGLFALVQFAMRGKPRYGGLTPAGEFFSLRYDEEVRTPLPQPESTSMSETERKMMGQLIASAMLEEPPVLSDKVSTYVADYADAKAAAGDNFTPTVTASSVTAIAGEEDLDLTALLGAALAAHEAA